MADLKISQLPVFTSAVPATDAFAVVSGGTTKQITTNQILGSSGVATLASATITGALTANGGIAMANATAITSGGAVALYVDTNLVAIRARATNGIRFQESTGVNNLLTVSDAGVFGFLDGAGGTRMTLNSTGLGIGVSPATKLDILSAAAEGTIRLTSTIDGSNASPKASSLSLRSGSASVETARIASFNRFSNVGGGDLVFSTADTSAVLQTRAIIDSSGNVGIGNTPTTAWRAGARALQVGVSKYVSLHEQSNGSTNLAFSNYESAANVFSYTTGDAPTRYAQINGAHQWYNAAAGTANTVITFGDPKMSLDASGNLLVGTTGSLPSFANGRIEVLAAASSYCLVADATATSAAAIGIRGNDSTVAASFYNASTGGTVGSIVINSGGVSYNTTSDYRLKESVKPISGGLARVNALKPSIYNWKSNGSTGEGFIAHELAEVVPFAVSGEKDAMNADGTIKSQGIDMSRIVPILVAAIQELTARVQTLEAR